MNCPHCASSETRGRAKKTVMGYRIYQCQQCRRTFNERSGTPFNYLEYPTDIVLLVVVLATSDIRSKTRNTHLCRNPYRLLLEVEKMSKGASRTNSDALF